MMITSDESGLPTQEKNTPPQKKTSLRWERAWITICLLLHIGILQIVVNLFLPAELSLTDFPRNLAPFFLTGLLVHFLPPVPTRSETALGITLFCLFFGIPALLLGGFQIPPSMQELFVISLSTAGHGALLVGSGMVGYLLGSTLRKKRS